jgi:hypothetical protein
VSQLGSGSVRGNAGRGTVAALVLAASVAVATFALLTYEAWWALAAIPFGLVLVGLERQCLSLAAAFAMAAVIAGSLLAIGMGLLLILLSQAVMSAACDPNATCTSGNAGALYAGFALLGSGIVGLILSARWLRHRGGNSGRTRAP